jgi:hypothetical protein
MTPEEEEFEFACAAQLDSQAAAGGFDRWCELYMTRVFSFPTMAPGAGDLVSVPNGSQMSAKMPAVTAPSMLRQFSSILGESVSVRSL